MVKVCLKIHICPIIRYGGSIPYWLFLINSPWLVECPCVATITQFCRDLFILLADLLGVSQIWLQQFSYVIHQSLKTFAHSIMVRFTLVIISSLIFSFFRRKIRALNNSWRRLSTFFKTKYVILAGITLNFGVELWIIDQIESILGTLSSPTRQGLSPPPLTVSRAGVRGGGEGCRYV
jgi:hypothetical protein